MHAYASVRTTCLVCVSLLIVRPGFGGYREIFVSSDWGWDASPCVGDADNDGLNELVATAYDHVAVYSWDGESFVLDADWHLDGVQAAFGPAVGDADNDSTNEVLVGTWAHSVLSFQHTEGSYLPEETFPWSDYGNWSIAIRDLHDTPGNEVLVSGRYGNFYAFHKGDSGYKLYYTSPELGSGDNVRVLILGIGDTDGNGVSDVITYCQQGALDAFEVDGSGFKHTWHMQFDNGDNPDDQCGAGTVKDVDDDGTAEVFYADAYGNVVGLRHDGADYVEFWRRSLDWVPFSLAVGDVDRDDAAEVIVGGWQGELTILDMVQDCATYLGKFEWNVRVALGDATNDGWLELLAGEGTGHVHVFVPAVVLEPWVTWSFEDFSLGSVHNQGTCEAPWIVPPGADAPQVVKGNAHNGVNSLNFALTNASACAVEHDMTAELAMPASGLWEISFAFWLEFDSADELRLVVEDRNLVTDGENTGPCVQFALINGPSGAFPALWDSGAYNDLRDELGINWLQEGRWYQVVIACDADTETTSSVTLWWQYPPRHSGPLSIPSGGSAGPGADHGLPEWLTFSLIGSPADPDTIWIDTVTAEEGYTTDNPPWDDLARALQHIYRGGWPQMYIDMANQILGDPAHSEEDYIVFFSNYFSDNYMNWDLVYYLGYPTFWWGSDQQHAKLQNATVKACRQVAFSIVDENADDLAAAFRADFALGETCAWLHHWIADLIRNAEHISPATWSSVDADYLAHFAAYPQYYDASVTFDPCEAPWLALIRAQAWLVTRAMFPLDPARKALLADAWGLSGDPLRIFEDTDVLILDNNGFNTPLYALIYDFLMSLPPGSKNLQALSCYDELRCRESFNLSSPATVNIWNGDPASGNPSNPFPDDIAPSYTSDMTEVLVHEVMHNIDAYHYWVSPQAAWYADRKDALIADAGCPHMHYLRSMFEDCFFVDNPQEFTASIGNQYFVDTAHTLELGLARWDAGYRQPINQWLFVAELFAKIRDDGTTRFWRIDTTASVVTADKRIRWAGDRITRVTLETGYGGSGWRFEFDENDMVASVHPLIGPTILTDPWATPAAITCSETSVLQVVATDDDDDDDDDDMLIYTWNPQQGAIVGSGPMVTFVPPAVDQVTLVNIYLTVEDLDGLQSEERTVTVEVHPLDGDLSGDCCVDQADLGILLADWGCAGGDCPGDCDNDGDTDQADLGILLAHWGEGCP